MIGCEKLCGRCDECYPLNFALAYCAYDMSSLHRIAASEDAPHNPDMRDRWEACRIILDPSELADLLARALRGRKARLARCSQQMTDPFDHIIVIARDSSMVHDLNMPHARSALSRLLALPLDCGAEKALAALEAS